MPRIPRDAAEADAMMQSFTILGDATRPVADPKDSLRYYAGYSEAELLRGGVGSSDPMRNALEAAIKRTGRSCGTCSLCCKLPELEALNKPANTWCQHCPTGKGGCAIYPDRPEKCQNFGCGWLTDPALGDTWFPARAKMYLTFARGLADNSIICWWSTRAIRTAGAKRHISRRSSGWRSDGGSWCRSERRRMSSSLSGHD